MDVGRLLNYIKIVCAFTLLKNMSHLLYTHSIDQVESGHIRIRFGLHPSLNIKDRGQEHTHLYMTCYKQSLNNMGRD